MDIMKLLDNIFVEQSLSSQATTDLEDCCEELILEDEDLEEDL